MIFVFVLGNAALAYANTAEWKQGGLLLTTFLLNLICIAIGFYGATRTKKLNLDTIIWVFVYMFFFLAPVVQLNYGPVFPNTMPIRAEDVWMANIVVCLWNFTFLLFRSKRQQDRQSGGDVPSGAPSNGLERIHDRIRTAYFLLAFVIFAFTVALFKLDYFMGLADYSRVVSNKSAVLLFSISCQGIVFANWIFTFDRRRRNKTAYNTFKLYIATIVMVHQLSPFNTTRFYIGFCLILIVYLFYYMKLKPSHFIWIIFTGLLFVFPFLNMFRYGISGYETPSLYHLMFDQLTELHFDAFANLAATMKYCAMHGYSYGYQMLGVLLFFVPREIWSGKPISSGEAIGDFVSGQYTLNFNNLSNPLPSEFFTNFGWTGVVIGAVLLALFVNKLEAGVSKNRYTHGLIAGYLFILLRGDLMNAFAYCFGTYVVMVLVPYGCSRLLNGKRNESKERRLSHDRRIEVRS
ncbi:O-antigen polysaccharide polymerase Wzy [Cohnella nanjingensis]|nr:O-antigen polysaccharide polymerase Wzy [Cohnella nanjingensis]